MLEDGFWLSRLNAGLRFFLAEGESKRQISGAMEWKEPRMELFVSDMERRMEYIVEVERLDGTE